MKIFISWSGNTSKEIAKVLKGWLPSVLQAVKPYFTPDDIEKGNKWQSDISKKLEESTIGIICLTPENLDSPWLHFEAGALSNRLDQARVCPLLFNVSKAQVKGPTSMFQLTDFDKEDFKILLRTVNIQLGEARISDEIFNKTFERSFPELKDSIEKIIKESNNTEKTESIERPDRELLEELLNLTRSNVNTLKFVANQSLKGNPLYSDRSDEVSRTPRAHGYPRRSKNGPGLSDGGISADEANYSFE
ncbi:MAG: hypothetical protein BM557_01120 [Flavobacterium sp. MedPE-SWcel]|uniref:toll/interleukin-1 receptor domain-containing protein n=1 Tax=uncultured Flavobacterium sp. TaxID=165435 RepID=UPI000922CABC|nr:toll/interleukin-1 receptor domain-containing protein [uncultured Flavobacterium sp.]OIQ22008.1 MAG: hypothetical protein BM557_01120 [Flavobacterium sp. MedPE-SWcel]